MFCANFFVFFRVKKVCYKILVLKMWSLFLNSNIAYEPLKHHRIANCPGMRERTITIGSAGKTWSVTGWKLGWAIGPDYLIKPVQVAWGNAVGFGITPVEHAV